MKRIPLLNSFSILAILFAGCSGSGGKLDSQISTPALYGETAGKASGSIPRVRPMTNNADWAQAQFACVQTELSPATLFHCSSKSISFFTHLAEAGLGAPSFAAFNTPTGPKVYKNGQAMDTRWVEENWVLVWFSGAPGWTNWDSPWVVYLQHTPASITLDEAGLHFAFKETAGDVVLMPLYGYDKLPLPRQDFLAAHGLPPNKVKTWEWTNGIPREPLMRVKYWASALREFPVYCEDSFSVDRSKESVTIRQKFHWHSIRDDWKTRHIKVAPVSPPLALAAIDRHFPVTFSQTVRDFELFTPYGPYMGVENVDAFDTTFKVLPYVNETEAADMPGTNAHPSVQAALDKLQKTARGKFRRADKYEYDHGGMGNFCWAIMGDQWYAKALPYMDEATRTNALASLRKYFHEDVLVTNRLKVREFPNGSGRAYFILEGPGIGSWGVLGDAGKFSANLLETLWAYAHFTGDWDLLKDRWDIIKKLFCTPAEARWVGFGRDAIAEMGDEAAPCLAMARMAYKVGDVDTYNYACYMFARELVHHYLKQRGAEYYRRHQPSHSMEALDGEVYLTNLWGDTAAWQIDGPNYPARTGERQHNNRWVRFKDADVGRFYRDFLKADVKKELDLLQIRWDPKRKYNNDSHIMPSLVQLRSLLLNETPDELAQVASPERFTGPASGVLGSCLAVIRTSHPIRYERLIPGGKASPFVAGLEREVSGPNPYLCHSVQCSFEDKKAKTKQVIWPSITWWRNWKTPNGQRWTFGQVTPDVAPPSKLRTLPLNWNTQVAIYE